MAAETKTRQAIRADVSDAPLTLILQYGREVVARPLPPDGALDIGRDAACAIVVDDDSVSRRHARVHCGDALAVEDLGSTNGTRVNGAQIEKGERAPIAPGAVIEIGDVVAFVRRGPIDSIAALTSAPQAAPDAKAPVIRDVRMREIYKLADIVAPSPFCVLVLGETGVGKDVFAETLHRRSPGRARSPLMRLNCAALPESILESELFGHEKGAFTGAVATKPGLFEAADGGTVFLDEVGDMPLTTQAKVLRVLESGEVLRIGSVKPKKVDVRFVSATNKDLQAMCETGEFRADLYFRLSGVVITIPPLRERPADIEALAEHFAADTAKRLGRARVSLSEQAIAKLRAYSWPGNIRELRNVIDRAVLMCTGRVLEDVALASSPMAAAPSSGPPSAKASTQGGPVREQLREIERERILDALDKCGGNQSRAAKMLGIPRRTFVKRLDAYGIVRPRKGQDEDE